MAAENKRNFKFRLDQMYNLIAVMRLLCAFIEMQNLPLFFCVRAISFSISEIFSKIPIFQGFRASQFPKFHDNQ